MKQRTVDLFFIILLLLELFVGVLSLLQQANFLRFICLVLVMLGTIYNWIKFFRN